MAGSSPTASEIDAYLGSLHLEDLALASACAEGNESAWEHFVREQRPALYRCADALEAGGGARDLADSLYGELFGVGAQGDARQSLFRHFHGRSTLATWLRAVLAQRYVDRMRSRRVDPLPEDDSPGAPAAAPAHLDPDRDRRRDVTERALQQAAAALPARDRLRVGCYYAEGLTLAQIGRVLGEHEATVSRQLARVRKSIRVAVERVLRDEAGWTSAQISQAFAEIADDPGSLDLRRLLGRAERKEVDLDRSKDERQS
ncbi:MAG TPA: sigma-70 family RNA polymerase sigma factor [Vicinamibacterales bacterium]|nr:sigma-70 family RNA polymerase sigma factor [Vicinamibacterales bacterium]